MTETLREDPDLIRGSQRWKWVGTVMLLLLVIAFPVFKAVESSSRADAVRSHFGPLVFDTVVPRSVRLAEAPSHGQPITAYDARSAGADAYYRVAMEVVERG